MNIVNSTVRKIISKGPSTIINILENFSPFILINPASIKAIVILIITKSNLVSYQALTHSELLFDWFAAKLPLNLLFIALLSTQLHKTFYLRLIHSLKFPLVNLVLIFQVFKPDFQQLAVLWLFYSFLDNQWLQKCQSVFNQQERSYPSTLILPFFIHFPYNLNLIQLA